MAGSGDTIHFGSLEFPALPPIGMWVPLIFEPSQAFLFGNLNFAVDRLGVLHLCVLHLHEEALVPAPVGGVPSIGSGTHDNFNDAASTLHSEQTLCSNPAVSNVHTIIYLLFTIFRQLSGGTPLSTPRPPCNRFPYGLASQTGRVRSGAPKDAGVAPSHIRIRGNGELCSHHFPRTLG